MSVRAEIEAFEKWRAHIRERGVKRPATVRRYNRQSVQRLHDRYVKLLLCGKLKIPYGGTTLPQALIAGKREELRFKRLILSAKKEGSVK